MAPIELIKDNIPDIRFVKDMKDVIYDQKWLASAPNFEVYFMYRGLAKNDIDKEIMQKNSLRYDITVMSPKMLGMEFPKTLGHEHSKIQGANLTYAEIYELLAGECDFLLQRRDGDSIMDIYVVKARKGEKIIIPPNYAHFMLNVLDQDIIMANWSEKNFRSDYAPIKEKHGGAYYALRKNDGSIDWVKNKNYLVAPELKFYEAKDFAYMLEQFGINPDEPMYNLVNNIEKLDFLKNPQKYNWDK